MRSGAARHAWQRRIALATWLFSAIAAAATFTSALAADDRARLPAAIDRIRPSIVAVGTSEPTRNPTYQFRGTGFVIADGTIVATNNHVIALAVDATHREVISIAVPRPGGDAIVREAAIIARDEAHDVALLKLTGPPLPAVRLGDSSQVREGQMFAFTGFPIGGAIGIYPTTHHAYVSAIVPITLPPASARTLDPALIKRLRSDRFSILQLDATAYPGNSGSPMFAIDSGDVVAIVNMVFVKGGKETALTAPSGISYAIPSIYISRLLDSLKVDETQSR